MNPTEFFDLHVMFRTLPQDDDTLVAPKDAEVIHAFSSFIKRHKIQIPIIRIPFQTLTLFLIKYPLTAFLLSKKDGITKETKCVHLLYMRVGSPFIDTYKTFEEAKDAIAQTGYVHPDVVDFDSQTGNTYITAPTSLG